MRCNNKHILERRSDDEKLIEGVVSYVNDEIKNDRKILCWTCNRYSPYKKNIKERKKYLWWKKKSVIINRKK